MNRNNQNQTTDKIKESWYFVTPKNLYSLCIDSLVHNVNIILVKNNQTKASGSKYYLAETVGIIPQNISQSLIKSYANYYIDQLKQLERNEYFNNKNEKSDKQQQLVSYYDLLLALASRSDRVYLNKIEYNQCLYSNSNFKSMRAQQPAHLDDKELKLLIKNKHCEYLDVCPCFLTNKSVHFINKYSNNSLKFLRLQNCCDWSKNLTSNNEDEDDDSDDYDIDFKSYFDAISSNDDSNSDSDNDHKRKKANESNDEEYFQNRTKTCCKLFKLNRKTRLLRVKLNSILYKTKPQLQTNTDPLTFCDTDINATTGDEFSSDYDENFKSTNQIINTNKKKRVYNLEKTYNRSLQIKSFHLVNLNYLSLRNLDSNVININLLNNLFKEQNLPNLTYLDISNCCANQMYRQSDQEGLLDGLLALKSKLTHLIMADLNADEIQANFKYLLQLKQLKYLDISNCREITPINKYKNASVQLAKLVYHLNKLTHLDISGTNLGDLKEQEEIDFIKQKLYEDLIDYDEKNEQVKLDEIETIESDITGLMFLNNEQMCLTFLGLFGCDNEVYENIPALRIASNDCEKNLYTSLQAYLNDRPLFVLDALNHLFEEYRDEMIEEKLLGGHLIMDAMEKNLSNSRIQISGSASLFYVLKYWNEANLQFPPFYLKRLIQTVITSMEEHINDQAVKQNCVLILIRLNLPDDALFLSERLIRIVLKIFNNYIQDKEKNPANVHRQEHFVLRAAMHLLNILACGLNRNDKLLVGSLAIPVVMNLIKTKIRAKESDDILEVGWSFLWNITDETSENSKLFLDSCDGMSVFMECLKFKKSEITRSMMGLMCNVAEVKELRNRLCKNDYIAAFLKLLSHSNEDIEISYNSAGVLVNIISDGLDAWLVSDCCQNHKRDLVIKEIETTIDKWNLKSERNITYRSFEPIFRLVEQYDNPICQRWACWALANLTTVYPGIYCKLFEKENGPYILTKIINNSQVDEKVQHFSRIVLINLDNKKKESNQIMN